jgi:hypothetical protein
MQFQIECNHAPFQTQQCLICNRLFEMTEAKVIACSDQGKSYGEVCPNCLQEGFDWISDRFDQLNQPKRRVTQRAQNRRISVGV